MSAVEDSFFPAWNGTFFPLLHRRKGANKRWDRRGRRMFLSSGSQAEAQISFQIHSSPTIAPGRKMVFNWKVLRYFAFEGGQRRDRKRFSGRKGKKQHLIASVLKYAKKVSSPFQVFCVDANFFFPKQKPEASFIDSSSRYCQLGDKGEGYLGPEIHPAQLCSLVKNGTICGERVLGKLSSKKKKDGEEGDTFPFISTSEGKLQSQLDVRRSHKTLLTRENILGTRETQNKYPALYLEPRIFFPKDS